MKLVLMFSQLNLVIVHDLKLLNRQRVQYAFLKVFKHPFGQAARRHGCLNSLGDGLGFFCCDFVGTGSLTCCKLRH